MRTKRPGYKAIRCFLADEAYVENDLATLSHRTDALVWIGDDHHLQQLILDRGNVNQIIENEIRKFHEDFNPVFGTLAQYAGEELVIQMIRNVEDFIRETISDAYD